MTEVWQTMQDKVLFPLMLVAILSGISGIVLVIRMSDKVEALEKLQPLEKDVAVIKVRLDRVESSNKAQWRVLRDFR